MKTVIYNDTEHAFGKTHFGCQLVMRAIHELCEQVGIEILGTIPLDDCRAGNIDRSLLDKADLVLVNGEGSLHHGRRPDLVRIAARYPAALINTVYQDNNHTAEELQKFRYIAVRESASKEAIEAAGATCSLVPDIILAGSDLGQFSPTTGADAVIVDHGCDTNTLQDFSAVLPVIARAKTVTTGSYHAALAAIFYNKPLSVWPSNSHKINGLSADARIPLSAIKQTAAGATPRRALRRYQGQAREKIIEMLETLARL